MRFYSLNFLWNRSRILIITFFILVFSMILLMYKVVLGPVWVRSLAKEITMRAELSSDQINNGIVFSVMKDRPEPEMPFICMNRVANFSWDKVYFIGSVNSLDSFFSKIDWTNIDKKKYIDRLTRDDRYQLIVFVSENKVVDHAFYFTLWADVSDLDRPQGYEKNQSVFTAESNGYSFRLAHAESDDFGSCSL